MKVVLTIECVSKLVILVGLLPIHIMRYIFSGVSDGMRPRPRRPARPFSDSSSVRKESVAAGN